MSGVQGSEEWGVYREGKGEGGVYMKGWSEISASNLLKLSCVP